MTASFRQREERLGGFLRDEGQVDVLSWEGALVGTAEQEQCLGEVDRTCVDCVEAVDELGRVALGIVAGHLEERLRDRQRSAQLVGGVRRESLLLGDVRFEPREHGIEAVGELAELVVAAFELDPVGERSGCGHACRVRDASQGGEHAAGEEPPSHETEDEQERQHDGSGRSEGAPEGAVAAHHEDHTRVDTARKGEVPDHEQHGTDQHEEADVAEGELEASAQSGRSSHGLLPHTLSPVACRCGIRRRPRWR